MVLVPLAARDAAESLQKAPNSVVSGGRQRRRASLTVPVPPAHPLLPDALPKRSIWVSITARWYKSLNCRNLAPTFSRINRRWRIETFQFNNGTM